MKRTLALVLCMLLSISLVLSGCGSSSGPAKDSKQETKQADATQKKEEQKPAAADPVSAPGTFPIVKDKINLKFFAPQNANIKDLNTNEFTKFYEEKTNIHIVWETVPQQALNEKRNLVLASGDYPDVFFGAGITREDEMLYGPQGVFIPLNELIDKYGVETKRMFSEVPYIQKGITTPDGNIYTLPQVNECYHCMFSQKLWINNTWLKKLGLSMPTTTEEAYQVFKAFKEKDPNGNGKQDEIPLSGALKSWRTFVPDYFICAFIYTDGVDRLDLRDGKIVPVYDKPEFRDGLRYLNKLYKEGLIDPAAFTQDQNQLKQLAEKPDAQVLGAATGGWFGIFTSLTGERHKDYEAVPPLKGPNGVQTTANYPYTFTTGTFAITKSNKYPEASFRYADWLYSLEAALMYVECGREGKEWRKANPDEKDFDGRPAKWARIDTYEYGEIQNVHYYQMGPSYRSKEYRESWATPQDPYDPKGYELRLHLATKKYDGFQPKEIIPPLYMGKDDVNTLSQLKTPINDFVQEAMSRFITGDLDIEKDWDKYVKDLENMGLKKYVELYQKAYDNSAYSKK